MVGRNDCHPPQRPRRLVLVGVCVSPPFLPVTRLYLDRVKDTTDKAAYVTRRRGLRRRERGNVPRLLCGQDRGIHSCSGPVPLPGPLQRKVCLRCARDGVNKG